MCSLVPRRPGQRSRDPRPVGCRHRSDVALRPGRGHPRDRRQAGGASAIASAAALPTLTPLLTHWPSAVLCEISRSPVRAPRGSGASTCGVSTPNRPASGEPVRGGSDLDAGFRRAAPLSACPSAVHSTLPSPPTYPTGDSERGREPTVGRTCQANHATERKAVGS